MKKLNFNVFQEKNGKKLALFGGAAVLVCLLLGSLLMRKPQHHAPVLFGENPHFAENTFRILVVNDDNDESVPYGFAAYDGVEAAVQKLNEKGGILSRKVSLSSLSVGSTDSDASAIVAAALKKTPVQLLIDASREDVSVGVAKAAHAAKTPSFMLRDGSCRTGSGLPLDKISPFLWTMGLTRESEIEPFLTFLSEKRSKPESEFQVLFLSGDFSVDQETIDAVRKASESLTFKTSAALTYDVRVEDFYPVAREILGRLPDLVFIANRLRPNALFMEQATKLALNRDMALAGLHVFDEEWKEDYGKNIDGVYTMARYTSLLDNAENKEMLSYLSRGKKPPEKGKEPKDALVVPTTPTTAAGWSAVLAFAQAANAANSIDIAAVSKKFEDLELKLPNGSAFFDMKNHILVQKMYALRVKGSKYEVIDLLGDAHHPELVGCH